MEEIEGSFATDFLGHSSREEDAASFADLLENEQPRNEIGTIIEEVAPDQGAKVGNCSPGWVDNDASSWANSALVEFDLS